MKKSLMFIIVISAAGAGYAATGYKMSPQTAVTPPDLKSAAGRIVRVYDVHALIERQIARSANGSAAIPNTPSLDLQNASQGLFQKQSPSTPKPMDSDAEWGAELSELILGHVAVDSWVENGGDDGTIRYAAGMLIVENSAEVQKQVADLLDKLDENE